MRAVRATSASTAQAHFNAGHVVGMSHRRPGTLCRRSIPHRNTHRAPDLVRSTVPFLVMMQQGKPQYGQVWVDGAGRLLAFCCLSSDIQSFCRHIENLHSPFEISGCAHPFLHHGSERHDNRSGLKPYGVPVPGLQGGHETADWCKGRNPRDSFKASVVTPCSVSRIKKS